MKPIKRINYKHNKLTPITKVFTAIRNPSQPEKPVTWEELLGSK